MGAFSFVFRAMCSGMNGAHPMAAVAPVPRALVWYSDGALMSPCQQYFGGFKLHV